MVAFLYGSSPSGLTDISWQFSTGALPDDRPHGTNERDGRTLPEWEAPPRSSTNPLCSRIDPHPPNDAGPPDRYVRAPGRIVTVGRACFHWCSPRRRSPGLRRWPTRPAPGVPAADRLFEDSGATFKEAEHALPVLYSIYMNPPRLCTPLEYIKGARFDALIRLLSPRRPGHCSRPVRTRGPRSCSRSSVGVTVETAPASNRTITARSCGVGA